MEKVGLVLEGGGMRGVYTCGVLEYFMDKELYFDYIIGVSAGACNAVSYISRQKERNKIVSIQYARDPRYMSFRNMIKEKSYFGMNFIFEEIPNKYVPFDFETFQNAACKFLVGVTDCKTGEMMYLEKEDITEGFDALRSAISLPLISPIVKFKGYELLDGGIANSIPIEKSIQDGNKKNIVILTRNQGYKKEPTKFKSLLKWKYRKYPLLVEAMLNRYKKYNETIEYIEQQEKEGNILVIRPSKQLKVGRLERDIQKLSELYQDGYEDAKRSYENIIKFISEK